MYEFDAKGFAIGADKVDMTLVCALTRSGRVWTDA